MDAAILYWSCIAVVSSFFHHPTAEENPIVVRLSLVYEIAGCYLYARAYLKSIADMHRLIKCVAIVVVPLAVVMFVEAITHRSVYGMLGAAVQDPWMREGRLRVAGPFSGSILSGSAGATAAVLMIPLFWSPAHKDRRAAIIGFGSCLMIVYCSASSGPILALGAGVIATALWRWRRNIGTIRTSVIAILVVLHLIMKAPVWYLISRIDIVGGSSSWGRAELITQALNHLDEWWFMGTDYTRHWMPYGIEWSSAHTDITSYYIKMGVLGGLPLMLAFILILFRAFQFLGSGMHAPGIKAYPKFILWCIGATLFAHAVNFFSISYYDQNYVPVFLLIGSLTGLCTTSAPRRQVIAEQTGADVFGDLNRTRVPAGSRLGFTVLAMQTG